MPFQIEDWVMLVPHRPDRRRCFIARSMAIERGLATSLPHWRASMGATCHPWEPSIEPLHGTFRRSKRAATHAAAMNSRVLISLVAAYLAVCQASTGCPSARQRAVQRGEPAGVGAVDSGARLCSHLSAVAGEIRAIAKISSEIKLGKDNDAIVRRFEKTMDELSGGSMRAAHLALAEQLGATEGDTLETAAARIFRKNPSFEATEISARRYFGHLLAWKKVYCLVTGLIEAEISLQIIVSSLESLEAPLRKILARCERGLEELNAELAGMESVCQILSGAPMEKEALVWAEAWRSELKARGSSPEAIASATEGASLARLYYIVGSVSETIKGLRAASETARGADCEALRSLSGRCSEIEEGVDEANNSIYEQLGADSLGTLIGSASKASPSDGNFGEILTSVELCLASLRAWREEVEQIAQLVEGAPFSEDGEAAQPLQEAREGLLRDLGGTITVIGERDSAMSATHAILAAKVDEEMRTRWVRESILRNETATLSLAASGSDEIALPATEDSEAASSAMGKLLVQIRRVKGANISMDPLSAKDLAALGVFRTKHEELEESLRKRWALDAANEAEKAKHRDLESQATDLQARSEASPFNNMSNEEVIYWAIKRLEGHDTGNMLGPVKRR